MIEKELRCLRAGKKLIYFRWKRAPRFDNTLRPAPTSSFN